MADTQVVVLGGGPGGYAAAFMAADLGLQTTLVDTVANPGGVCLYKGCIPSKALLHAARVLAEAKEAEEIGIAFGKPKVDVKALAQWKEGVIAKLTGGLGQLAKQRKVKFIQGRGKFLDATTLEIAKAGGGKEKLTFEKCILATGSRPTTLPGAPDSKRIWDSTAALELKEVPKRLLVVGGGYIGLELGTVYAALGSQVDVVEMLPTLLTGADRDLVVPLAKRLEGLFHDILLETKVAKISDKKDRIEVKFEKKGLKDPVREYDAVLVSIGRRPNTEDLGLEKTKVKVEKGFVVTDHQTRTAEPTIFAVGDVAGQPMLAHKASHEGKVAAEVCAGKPAAFEPQCIPAVVFTDPEIAWVGLTETEAKAKGRKVEVSRFPWAASGRALSVGRTDGVTKIVSDPVTQRVLGVGIAGIGAGDMISEGALAIEMGANLKDLALTIHPHPTLSESVGAAAEILEGTCTDLYRPKRKNAVAA